MASVDANDQSAEISRALRRIRTHRKSRAGCYTCKGRRVKCCETRPVCQNCSKSKLECVYPESQPKAISIGLGRVQYQSSGFDLKDLRFFHNYMTISWPHLPLHAGDAWLNDMPLLAQEHEFFMHAILALGASNIHARTGRSMENIVNRHRRLAMKGVLEVENIRDSTEANREVIIGKLKAALGTCYVLTYAASYMWDVFPMWIILYRSCASFMVQLWATGYQSPFLLIDDDGFSEKLHLDVMQTRLADARPLSPLHVAQARIALAQVREHCTFAPVEQKIFDFLQGTLDRSDQPFESYRIFAQCWKYFVEMSPEDLTYFIDPNHTSSVVLQAYFLAFETMLRPWSEYEMIDGRSIMEHREPAAMVFAVGSDVPDADAINALLAWPASMFEGLAQHGARYFDLPGSVSSGHVYEIETDAATAMDSDSTTPSSFSSHRQTF